MYSPRNMSVFKSNNFNFIFVVQTVGRINSGWLVGRQNNDNNLNVRGSTSKYKYLPTYIISTCVESMKMTMLFFFYLILKVIVANIMSTKVRLKVTTFFYFVFQCYHVPWILVFYLFYCNLKGKYYIRWKINGKKNFLCEVIIIILICWKLG